MKKVVLAYSGGLDTSVILKWLQEEKNLEVITYTADLGQGDISDDLEEKAKNHGAEKVIVEDLTEEFISDYNSYKGNAYGLANTLFQTAFLKPRIRNNKVRNLYYTGQLTVPGPGMPPALVSGKIVADQISKDFN